MHAVTRSGAAEIATAIYKQKRGYLLAIAYNNSACRLDAEEALQEALCAFVGAYDPHGESPPLPWLILTLKRECWRRLRLIQRQWDRRKFDWTPRPTTKKREPSSSPCRRSVRRRTS